MTNSFFSHQIEARSSRKLGERSKRSFVAAIFRKDLRR
jgi:hypothetical protein